MGYKAKNNAYSTLAAGITNVATTMTVQTGHGDRFPVITAPDYTYVTLEDAGGNREIVKVTARAAAADAMTIVRAQEGTTAIAWASGSVAELRMTAGSLENAINSITDHIANPTGAHAAAAISNTPAGNIASTNVQAALNELDAEKQAVSSKDASGGYAGLTLFKINFINVANTFVSFFTNANTAARTYTFQDRDGTILDSADAVAPATHAAASKATPVDADEIPLSDSAAAFGLKRLTWANLKATLLANGVITPAKLSTGAPSWDTSSRFTVTGAMGIGVTAADTAKLAVEGTGQASNTYTDAGNNGATLKVTDTGSLVNSGGVLAIGGKPGTVFAGFKGQLADGTTNTVGNLAVLVRRAISDTSMTEVARYSVDGSQSSVIQGGSTLYPEYKCRAWVNFNGTGTVAIRASGNVSSITDNGVGDYTVNFTTAMPDANYAISGGGKFDDTAANAATPGIGLIRQAGSIVASSCRIGVSVPSTGAAFDATYVTLAIFR